MTAREELMGTEDAMVMCNGIEKFGVSKFICVEANKHCGCWYAQQTIEDQAASASIMS